MPCRRAGARSPGRCYGPSGSGTAPAGTCAGTVRPLSSCRCTLEASHTRMGRVYKDLSGWIWDITRFFKRRQNSETTRSAWVATIELMNHVWSSKSASLRCLICIGSFGRYIGKHYKMPTAFMKMCHFSQYRFPSLKNVFKMHNEIVSSCVILNTTISKFKIALDVSKCWIQDLICC